MPQSIWNGLRKFEARIDLAPYPVASFVLPAGWNGDGWTNQGFQSIRPHAILTDKSLTISRGRTVPLPFSRECAQPPQFALVAAAAAPAWSKMDGLWRPIELSNWTRLLEGPQASHIRAVFKPETNGIPSLDRMESILVRADTPGAYRLFAACPNPHYDSVAVTWIDIIAR